MKLNGILYRYTHLLAACLIVALLAGSSGAHEQNNPQTPARITSGLTMELDDTLPLDPHVVRGTLDNGLTYYIRKNAKPENRAELRLVVNAGSILEDDDQLGLAHFVEHMAFNGTKYFEKSELVGYLESIGMRFGPDMNAYTSFDETVYKLQIPTDDPETMGTAFNILEDWASGIMFDDEEIQKERGVIIEEWRSSRGAEARMRDRQFRVLFQGSRYAERSPIGSKHSLETFDHDALRRFYRSWYRPDLMAVVAVGDFDSEQIKKLIETHFGRIPSQPQPRNREMHPIPDHGRTLFAIASDPEATTSSVNIYHKLPEHHNRTVGEYRQRIIEQLYNGMFNLRLSELARQDNPPFLSGFSGNGHVVRTREFYMLSAVVENSGTLHGLETLLTEARRVQQHGFTISELEREKRAALRSMERIYQERDKLVSSNLAAEYVSSFLNGAPIPGIDYEFELFKKYIPTITLAEVNAVAERWITDTNRVIMVSSPDKNDISVPTENELIAMVNTISSASVEPYIDDVTDARLVETPPSPSPVVHEDRLPALGVTEWTLENGVHVVMKPTDFENDQILFSAFSPGGTSLVSDSDLLAAETAPSVIAECGVGRFSQNQLQKMLSDKIVKVSPFIDTLREGISGYASPHDVETLFQLVYLYFTAPRKDTSAFSAYKARMEGICRNRDSCPEAAFQDTVTATITQNNPRFKPMTTEKLKELDLDKSFEIYRNRFADASDFTFLFVGSFDPEQLKPFIETYLGGLPTLERKESWQDVTYENPSGVIEKSVKKGVAPKSLNSIIFSGQFDWTRHNRFVLSSLADVLRIRMRERIREDLGGTYGVNIQVGFIHYPKERYQIKISFGCSPERAEELSAEVFKEIDELKTSGTTNEYLNKVKEMALRKHEVQIKTNLYWLNALRFSYFHGEAPQNILSHAEAVKHVTLEDIQKAAHRYLDRENYVKVVLYPEEWEQ